ncbi:MAG: glycosyltransferase, partial [Clostridia bacterium]
ILVGDGDLKEKIIEKINSLKLNENVLLLGTRKDIAELLIASDIFLLPSLFEGLPFTLIEAQATGIKCVVSDMVPIDAKILDNYEIVSLESTPSNFAKFIIKDEFYDRNFAAEIVKQKGYDIIEAAKNLEDYYLSLYKRSNFNENR